MLLGAAAALPLPQPIVLAELLGRCARMKRSAGALLLLLAWAAGLAALGLLVERRLDVGSDLRLFLPAPATPEQRLLLEAIGEGPARACSSSRSKARPPRRWPRRRARWSRAARRRAVPLRRERRRRRSTRCPRTCCRIATCCRPTTRRARSIATASTPRSQARARDLASPAGFASSR